MPATEEKSRYQIASGLTSIFKVLKEVGIEVPSFNEGNVRVECPFCQEMAFRIYAATDSTYCFSCAKRWGPVQLIAEYRGISLAEAAEYVIEKEGYTPPSVDARWEALMAPTLTIDRSSEAEALKVFCKRQNAAWDSLQFEETVADRLTKCLSALDKVQTNDDLRLWRSTTRRIMKMILEPKENSDG